jgi:hypothetical protein
MAEILGLIQEFHANKAIVHAKGYRTTEGFKIPKLELQHHIVPTIMATGNLLGSSTDTTEHGHIEFVKGPYRMTNHRDFYPQMTDHLDKLERIRHFDLVTALHELEAIRELTGNQDGFASSQMDTLDQLNTVENLQGPKREAHTDYFAVIRGMERMGSQLNHSRIRTFSVQPFTAIHLNRDPDISSISIDEASQKFGLPDLHNAIKEYYYNLFYPSQDTDGPLLHRSHANSSVATIELPFKYISIWFNIKVQTKSLAEPGRVNRQQTLCAESKLVGNKWPFGRHDCALFINSLEKEFTGKANLKGGNPLSRSHFTFLTGLSMIDHCAGQLRLIFQGIRRAEGPSCRSTGMEAPYLVYAQRFDCVRSDGSSDPRTGLIRLKRAKQGDQRLGAVVEALRIRSGVSILPFFGEKADDAYTSKNSMELSVFFNLNKYADKEDFHLLHNA